MRKKGGSSTRVAIASALALGLLVAGIAYAATVTVDSFDDGEQNLQANSGNQTVYGYVDTTAAIGGERDAWLQYSSGTGSVYLDVDFQGTSNRFAYTSGDDVRGTARITWDGDDNDANSLDYNGLGRLDLTDNSANSGFHILILSEDLRAQLKITVYSYGASPPGNDWSSYSQYLAPLNPGTREELFIPFSAFTTGGGSGANFASVGAIVLEINNTDTTYTDMSVDVSIDFIEASDTIREYGDLPVGTYGTSILGAYHVPRGMRLGYNCDAETDYQSSTNADGDDSAVVDDEDGVAPSPGRPWTAGNYGGHLDITVNGCSSAQYCYVHGWIDWNNDGDFGDTIDGASEHVVDDFFTSNGTSGNYRFNTPTSFSNGYYYARFRICPTSTACDDPGESPVNDGEIEDYRWALGPTAVVINSFTAEPAPGGIQVAWQTADETDLAGFDLLRSTAENGEYLMLNDALIQAQHPGQPISGSYSWLDDDGLLGGVTYYYRLDVHDRDGQTMAFGPASATAWHRLYLPLVLK